MRGKGGQGHGQGCGARAIPRLPLRTRGKSPPPSSFEDAGQGPSPVFLLRTRARCVVLMHLCCAELGRGQSADDEKRLEEARKVVIVQDPSLPAAKRVRALVVPRDPRPPGSPMRPVSPCLTCVPTPCCPPDQDPRRHRAPRPARQDPWLGAPPALPGQEPGFHRPPRRHRLPPEHSDRQACACLINPALLEGPEKDSCTSSLTIPFFLSAAAARPNSARPTRR